MADSSVDSSTGGSSTWRAVANLGANTGASPWHAFSSSAGAINAVRKFYGSDSGWGPSSASSSSTSKGWLELVEEGASDMWEGATEGDFSNNNSKWKIFGQVAAGLIPVYGQAADARDTVAAAQDLRAGKPGALLNLGLSIAGWLPFAGDLIKSAAKGSRVADDVVEATTRFRNGDDIAGLDEAVAAAESKWFHTPEVIDDWDLPPGTGATDLYGNVRYSPFGSAEDVALALNHEMVHSYLSPKFLPARDLRALIAGEAYSRKGLFTYLEEALAEGYAQVKVNGWSSLPTALKFPLQEHYFDPTAFKTELGLVAGGAGIALLGASELGTELSDLYASSAASSGTYQLSSAASDFDSDYQLSTEFSWNPQAE